jgi:hypothetical protein
MTAGVERQPLVGKGAQRLSPKPKRARRRPGGGEGRVRRRLKRLEPAQSQPPQFVLLPTKLGPKGVSPAVPLARACPRRYAAPGCGPVAGDGLLGGDVLAISSRTAEAPSRSGVTFRSRRGARARAVPEAAQRWQKPKGYHPIESTRCRFARRGPAGEGSPRLPCHQPVMSWRHRCHRRQP